MVDLSWHPAGLSPQQSFSELMPWLQNPTTVSPQQGFLLSGAQASNYSVHYTQTSRYSIPAFNCRSSLRCSCIQLQWSLQLAGYSTVVTVTGSSPTDGKVWMPQAQQDISEICANCPSMEKHLFFSSNCSPWMSCTSVPVDECNPVVSEWKRFQPRKGAISLASYVLFQFCKKNVSKARQCTSFIFSQTMYPMIGRERCCKYEELREFPRILQIRTSKSEWELDSDADFINIRGITWVYKNLVNKEFQDWVRIRLRLASQDIQSVVSRGG